MSKKQVQDQPLSEYLSTFLNKLEETHVDYKWSVEEVKKLDQLTQDYLHKLELDELNYHEKAHVAIELSKTRQNRRLHKNQVESLEPVVNFLESSKGKNMVDLLKEVLGKVRKSEERIEKRMYSGRVLNETYK